MHCTLLAILRSLTRMWRSLTGLILRVTCNRHCCSGGLSSYGLTLLLAFILNRRRRRRRQRQQDVTPGAGGGSTAASKEGEEVPKGKRPTEQRGQKRDEEPRDEPGHLGSA
eukprot:COSAG05_NODE_9572_length_615_cov_0.893411_2_plen_110_part_01